MTDAPSTLPPQILDIRVHGVSNCPPAEMLESDPADIERVDGDTLGSFWARKDKAAKDGVSATQAFSWGGQTRTGGGALAAIGRAFVHVGWFLLLPYALVNLAYWTREIRFQPKGGTRAWHGDIGSGTVRVFGLVLTLIAVTAFCSVAIDLVAVQCFRGTPAEADQVCAALPSIFDGLRAFDVDSRAALLGLVPVIVILILYAIGRRGRVRFEARIENFGEQIGGADEPGRPLLATQGFWAGARIRDDVGVAACRGIAAAGAVPPRVRRRVPRSRLHRGAPDEGHRDMRRSHRLASDGLRHRRGSRHPHRRRRGHHRLEHPRPGQGSQDDEPGADGAATADP